MRSSSALASSSFAVALLFALCALCLVQFAAGASGVPDTPAPPGDGPEVAGAAAGGKKKKGDSIFHKGLVKEKITWQEIVKHANESETRPRVRFDNTVLGFITPWNSDGYRVALEYSKKFSIISPCWFTVGPDLNLRQTARNEQWLKSVDALPANYRFKLAPRIGFDGWTQATLDGLVSDPAHQREFLDQINIALRPDWGLVLDIGSLWPMSTMTTQLLPIIKDIKKRIVRGPFIITVPPRRAEQDPRILTPEQVRILSEFVDYFVVMTYDFTHQAGPNAPLSWMHASIDAMLGGINHDSVHPLASRILMGISFYGNDYVLPAAGHETVTGPKYLDILKRAQPRIIEWDLQWAEHTIAYSQGTEDHRLFYPTPHSINSRLKMALQHGVGASIWELGQGLEFFYDLL